MSNNLRSWKRNYPAHYGEFKLLLIFHLGVYASCAIAMFWTQIKWSKTDADWWLFWAIGIWASICSIRYIWKLINIEHYFQKERYDRTFFDFWK